jgi:hypothetical protein
VKLPDSRKELVILWLMIAIVVIVLTWVTNRR